MYFLTDQPLSAKVTSLSEETCQFSQETGTLAAMTPREPCLFLNELLL